MSVIFKLSYPILGNPAAEAAGATGAGKFCRLVESRQLIVSESIKDGRHEFSVRVGNNRMALELLVEMLDAGLSPDMLVKGISKDGEIVRAIRWAFATHRQPSRIEFAVPEPAANLSPSHRSKRNLPSAEISG